LRDIRKIERERYTERERGREIDGCGGELGYIYQGTLEDGMWKRKRLASHMANVRNLFLF